MIYTFTLMIRTLKTSLAIGLLVLASCSEDPEPQVPCKELKSQIEAITKQIAEHQAKGNGGNQAAWEAELKRLHDSKTVKYNEYKRRAC